MQLDGQPGGGADLWNQVLAKKPLAVYGCEITSSSGALSLFGKAGVPSFNCTNSGADFTYRWSFGIHPGATGEQAGWAHYACTLTSVKNVVLIGQDQAEQRGDSTLRSSPSEGCGQAFGAVYSPIVPTDYTRKSSRRCRQAGLHHAVAVGGADCPDPPAASPERVAGQQDGRAGQLVLVVDDPQARRDRDEGPHLRSGGSRGTTPRS